jgi:hypothetical protein
VQALAWMADRAAYAYERARLLLAEAAGPLKDHEFPIREFMRGTDYLEIAVNALLRAHLLAERLRREGSAPTISRGELLTDADLIAALAYRLLELPSEEAR